MSMEVPRCREKYSQVIVRLALASTALYDADSIIHFLGLSSQTIDFTDWTSHLPYFLCCLLRDRISLFSTPLSPSPSSSPLIHKFCVIWPSVHFFWLMAIATVLLQGPHLAFCLLTHFPPSIVSLVFQHEVTDPILSLLPYKPPVVPHCLYDKSKLFWLVWKVI